ncbi:MAG: WD40 repeat domain-containing protein [Ignavibacteria bacterium]|nr:WD40 repeat domain-containing protein [Ignavibacteria bacterium]
MSSCKIVETPVLENPVDPLSSNFQGKSPSDLSIEVLDRNKIILKWKNKSNYLLKNVVQRSDGDKPFYDLAETNGKDSFYIDETLNKDHYYSYRVSGVSSSGRFSISETINIKYEPYPDSAYKELSDVTSFSISPNYRYIAYKNNNEISIYDMLNDMILGVFSCDASTYVFSHDNNFIITGNNTTKTIEVRDITSGQVMRAFDNSGANIISMAISPDDSTLVSIDGTNNLKVFDVRTGKIKFSKPQPTVFNNDSRIIFSNEGTNIAIFSPISRMISITETKNWNVVHTMYSVLYDIFFFTKNDRYFAYNTYESYAGVFLHLLDVNTGIEIKTEITNDKNFIFSPDEKSIVLFRNNILEVWSVNDFKIDRLIKTITFKSNLVKVILTESGKMLALDNRNKLMIWSDKGNWVLY